MTGIIPLWLAVLAGAASLLATGYLLGLYPEQPGIGTLTTSYLGACTVASYVFLWYERLLYEGPVEQQVFGALFPAFIVSILWIPFMVILYGESKTSSEATPADELEASSEVEQ